MARAPLPLLLAFLLVWLSISDGFSSKSSILRDFYRMVDRFQAYSDDEIALLKNERLRHLVFGGRDALNEPRVVNAFAILYEDVMPVRFGGDILFNLLDKAIGNARTVARGRSRGVAPAARAMSRSPVRPPVRGKSRSIIRAILALKAQEDRDSSGESAPTNMELHEGLFSEIDANEDGRLSFEEFEAWVSSIPITSEEENRLANEWNPVEIFQEMDLNSDGSISQEEFKLWTTGAVSSLEKEGSYAGSLHDIPVPPKAAVHRERYLKMLRAFNDWERSFKSCCSDAEARKMMVDRVTPSSNRINHVIEGCFSGAKNPGVVKALGILYEDYLPLRLAGDTVFKLINNRVDRKVYL